MIEVIKYPCLIILVFIFLIDSCFGYETIMTREGCYVDLRGQIHSPYEPPHPENIPTKPRLQQPITNYEMYYKINMEGYRGEEHKLSPVPAEYTRHYSERTPHPYTKEQFIKVWQKGKKSGKIDCLTDKYAISFFFFVNWATGVVVAKWRAKRVPQKAAAFFFVEDMGFDEADMYKAKKWAELLGVKIFFATIDKQIPSTWVR